MFVTAGETSLCPTREQANARSCGHSVETVTQGVRRVRGTAITIVGSAPVDGQWRAIRFQKAGTLPGWIRADDVSERPGLVALEEYAARADVKSARAAEGLTAAAIAKLPPKTFVAWQRHRGVKFATAGSPDSTLYVPIGDEVVAVAVTEPEQPVFMIHHDCLIEGDCPELSYVCAESGYCDEVSILARTTGKRVKLSKDAATQWPRAPAGSVPLVQAVVIADRFGLHELGAKAR
jgi:hypothetical protein